MRFTIDTYWPLVLPLIVLPYVWWVQRRTITGLSPKKLKLLSWLRSATVLLLAIALMQPALHRTGVWLSVVYLLDVSKSVSPGALQSATQWIKQTNDTGNPDSARFIPFARNSIQLGALDQLKDVQVTDETVAGSIDQSGTNVEQAIDDALRSFARDHLKRLVLLTDGNENSGRMLNQLPRLRQNRVRVYSVPMSVRSAQDVWVETVTVPALVTAEETFPLEVHVYSQADAEGEVEIKASDKSLGSRTVKLAKGMNRVAFSGRITEDIRPLTVDAEVRVAGDAFPDNNQYRESIVVQGKPRVLYIESRAESAKYLKQALELEGFVVDTSSPASIPDALDVLDAYDTIVLSDVAKSNLTDRQMNSIATYVRDLGGGLIFAGGENTFGEGGYSKTVLEETLPVTFDLKKKPNSVAMIVVFDKSASMAGLKLALAKEASKAALQSLRDTDSFGVVAFDYNSYTPVALQPKNVSSMTAAIDRIVASGETNAYPALEQALAQLSASKSDIKHVILLSDGRSIAKDFETLTKKMATAKITVSSVAVGDGADRDLLDKIATWGQGRSYFTRDPARVPQIFIDETNLATGETLREEPFKAQVKKTVEAFKGIDFQTAPELLGYVRTESKETAEVLLEKEGQGEDQNDPILARWQYGLGKSVAFTSDLKDRWAGNWLQWNGYGKFWSQLVRQTMRKADDDRFDLQVVRHDNTAKITINSIEKDGRLRNNIQPQINVISPDQTTSVVNVHQTGPGHYEVSFPLSPKGSYLFRAADAQAGGPARMLAYSYPDEYHFYPPNIDLLRSMSAETGGKFQPEAQDIFASNGETTTRPIVLWPYLATTALGLFIVNLFLRRVTLFE
jgi:Ca-activated chloride channel homolog